MEIDTIEDPKFKIRSRIVLGEPESPAMIRFLVQRHMVKDEKQAMIALFATIGILLLGSIYLYTNAFSSSTPTTQAQKPLPFTHHQAQQ